MKVMIAMSGGVDSSVAAYELKKKGYDVVGMTMRTWDAGADAGERDDKFCCSEEAVTRAAAVCARLGMIHRVVDLSREFEEEVKSYFAKEYSAGRTPNPCIICNTRLKFGRLFSEAKKLGAEKIATGHFARIIEKQGEHLLCTGADSAKDQSYFLYALPRNILRSIVFPLGEITKEKVRRIASERGFVSAGTPSSQDICFAPGNGGYRKYLEDLGYASHGPGKILDSSGRILGTHKGVSHYTVGQRQGLGVAMGRPVYVISIDPVKNLVVVGPREEAMKREVLVTGLNWLLRDPPSENMSLRVKIRYASDKAKADLSFRGKGGVRIKFREPQFAPSPGQAAVFYDGEVVAGGGWIEKVPG
ncbi:MAG: tRNA 2-thiouridine(34) synthase MnmA [Candidatus Omnitrophica bacterium]|nr:tRNA 2-thiouridine(34) synthase MnmA [Candidatus Omnitrophota bacterium]